LSTSILKTRFYATIRFTLTLQTLLGHNFREDFSQNRFVGGLEFSSTYLGRGDRSEISGQRVVTEKYYFYASR